jgi:excisionase family DNA binding protein
MNQHEVIDDLRERIARLEAVNPRRRVYNQAEAAARLNMSVSKFRSLQYAGHIHGKRTGRVWLFTDADLDAYIAAPSNDSA